LTKRKKFTKQSNSLVRDKQGSYFDGPTNTKKLAVSKRVFKIFVFSTGNITLVVPWPIPHYYIIFRNVEIFKIYFFQIEKYWEGKHEYLRIFHSLK
jgi:hypothetical protein